MGTDVNECEVYGTCPQECKNTKGSYECFCADGFLSFGEPHGTECAAQGKSSAFKRWANSLQVPADVSLVEPNSPQTEFTTPSSPYRKPTSAAPARQRSHPSFQRVV